MASDIFISYSRKDKKEVASYADYLRTHGYTVWMDTTDLPIGHNFPAEIAGAIQECGMLLFFSSKSSNESRWVKREIVFADIKEKIILPIRLDNTEYHDSLQLLLSGVEHIDAYKKKPIEVKGEILSSVQREIGTKNDDNHCLFTNKPCPKNESEKKEISYVQEQIFQSNWRRLSRYRLRCEAFVFTSLCENIWLLILGCILIPAGILTHTLSIFICTTIAFFIAIYTTYLSTNSIIVPGWYNRHLTTYGALILSMDFFVSTACLSISSAFSVGLTIAILFFFNSIIGIIGIACIYRLKKIGYFLLWIDVLLFSVSSMLLWSTYHRIFGAIGLFFILVLAMLILTYTLTLRRNGSSTWGIFFGEKNHMKEQKPSAIERFLLKIWSYLFH